jgi:hypothetical protein
MFGQRLGQLFGRAVDAAARARPVLTRTRARAATLAGSLRRRLRR